MVDTEGGLLAGPAGRMASMSHSRRSFTPDYRVEAAHRVIDTDRTIAQVARDIGVGEQLLGRWVRDERARESAATATPPDVETPLSETERAELMRLRRRVREQEIRLEEREQDVAFLKMRRRTSQRCNRSDFLQLHRSGVRESAGPSGNGGCIPESARFPGRFLRLA